jgi:hypothetical protein
VQSTGAESRPGTGVAFIGKSRIFMALRVHATTDSFPADIYLPSTRNTFRETCILCWHAIDLLRCVSCVLRDLVVQVVVRGPYKWASCLHTISTHFDPNFDFAPALNFDPIWPSSTRYVSHAFPNASCPFVSVPSRRRSRYSHARPLRFPLSLRARPCSLEYLQSLPAAEPLARTGTHTGQGRVVPPFNATHKVCHSHANQWSDL